MQRKFGNLVATLGLAVAMSVSGASAVDAAQITGTISFGGEANPAAGEDWVTTTMVDFSSPIIVSGGTGDYAGLANTPVTFTDFTFEPVLSPNPVSPLWTFTTGGTTYSFTLSTIAVTSEGYDINQDSFLILSGSGTLSISGVINRDATFGTFQFSGNETAGDFSFSASNAARPTPEPGTVGLFGLALLGLGGAVRRRFAN